MIFSKKLQLIRKSKGLSQEALAERLNVSRQAIAKWESGHSYPEIGNLIALSEIFMVTVDSLVKDNEGCAAGITPVEIPDQEIVRQFLVRAKRDTYAGKGAETNSSRPASHDLNYIEEDLLYIDSYLGSELFAGEEAVWEKNVPIYTMNYCGRVFGQEFSGDFLKEALYLVEEEKPFRGPEIHKNGDYLYRCSVNGTMKWYQGYEEIYCHNTKVYDCYFHGGYIK